MNNMTDDEVCFSDDADEKEICSICFSNMSSEDSHTLEECDHRFHTKCILKWFRSKQDTCPLCRKHPLVKLKAPDVFHRAKTLIQKEKDGITSDLFVKDKMDVISESERMRLIYEKDLLQHKEIFKNVTKPRKEDLLRQYRILRKQFKDKSSPILKQLDDMDEKEHAERRRIRKSISQEQKKKRQALRDIGLHNIENREAAIPTRVYYGVDAVPMDAPFSFAARSPTFSES
tara:strand:+ start:1184 stop:1876 length:693 start_codon:yes stop_codon:yes gene_type:complete